MPLQTREVRPHPKERRVIDSDGSVLTVPEGWGLLAPGDAALTRRVKAAGPTWTVKAKKGRRIISLGIWADAETIEIERLKLLIERQSPTYKQKLEAGRQRRAREQERYAVEFRAAILAYLGFDGRYGELADVLATRICDHAVPVGSGTVARTERISIERRAEAATIAWMRHQTTAYDSMYIPRVKGERRETRRRLAQKSKALLDAYRRGVAVDAERCPLQKALRYQAGEAPRKEALL